MCWKRLFRKKPIKPSGTASKMALLFAINNYPGDVNDLNGCINDQKDIANKLKELFPYFLIKKFTDSEVTVNRFKDEIRFAITNLKKDGILLVHYSGHGTQVADKNAKDDTVYDEAIFLYDDVVTDNDVSELLGLIPTGAKVIMAFDSCYSGDMERQKAGKYATRSYNKAPHRANCGNRIASRANANYVVFSASDELELAYDAFIDGEYHGAFTYHWVKTMAINKTYNQWLTAIKEYLPSNLWDQTPELAGDTALKDKLIFA